MVVVNEWLGEQRVIKRNFIGYNLVSVEAWMGILQDVSNNYFALTRSKT